VGFFLALAGGECQGRQRVSPFRTCGAVNSVIGEGISPRSAQYWVTRAEDRCNSVGGGWLARAFSPPYLEVPRRFRMSRPFVPFLAMAAFALVAATTPLAQLACAQTGSPGHQEGSYQSYGPNGARAGVAPIQAPFLGTWTSRQPGPNNNGTIVTFGEYGANGNFRSTSIIQGGTLNGMRMQVWGRYTAKQLGPNRYLVASHAYGVAPQSLCNPGGGCSPNTVPETATETIEMLDANSFHIQSTTGQGTGSNLHRAQIPQQLTSQIAAQVTLPALPRAQGNGAAPTMPTLHPYVTPGGGNKTMGNNCDNAQQNRICTVNNGHMYTDSRGCQVCAGP